MTTIAGADARLSERTGRAGRERPGGYVEVRDPVNGKLLFEVSPERALIRIRRRWQIVIFSLASLGLEYNGKEDISAMPCIVDKRHLTS